MILWLKNLFKPNSKIMKPTTHRKDISLAATRDRSHGPVKRVGGDKTAPHTEVAELEALLDTDEDKILHLHDTTVGEDKQQFQANGRR
jgi:hypothetical protein